MKVCCSSVSYRRSIASGALTQLEWVDRCARDTLIDGIEFVAQSFPRTDVDYLAQLKKLCTDRCLAVAGAAASEPFGGSDVDASLETFLPWIERAALLGAPLLRFECGRADGSPGIAWREFVRALKTASVEAKRRNITLALQAGDGDALVTTPSDVRRALKECDSAWLRLSMRAADLDADKSGEWSSLINETVIVTSEILDDEEIIALGAAGYRGFISLCYAGDRDEMEAVPELICGADVP